MDRTTRIFDACQRHWDNLAPPDEQDERPNPSPPDDKYIDDLMDEYDADYDDPMDDYHYPDDLRGGY